MRSDIKLSLEEENAKRSNSAPIKPKEDIPTNSNSMCFKRQSTLAAGLKVKEMARRKTVSFENMKFKFGKKRT